MSKLSERNLKFETKQLHIGQETADPVTDARAVPIYATTSYVFHNSQHAADRFALKDAGNIYGRLTNPTEDVFEKRIAALEGGTAALAVASGAAAVSYALQALAKAGDNIVAAKTIYGGTYNWLEHTFSEYGVTTKFVDPDEENAFENAIDENTKAVFIESLGNPNSNIIDIEEVANIAHSHKIPLVIDSTFATPYLLRPWLSCSKRNTSTNSEDARSIPSILSCRARRRTPIFISRTGKPQTNTIWQLPQSWKNI